MSVTSNRGSFVVFLRTLNVVLTIIVVIVVIPVVLCGSYLYLVHSTSRTEYSDDSTINEYKITTFNPSTNEKSQGFVSLPETLQENDYISYKDSNGVVSLISDFNMVEHSCTVTCSCSSETDNERRMSRARAITLLVCFMALTVYRGFKMNELKLQNCQRYEESKPCYNQKMYDDAQNQCIDTLDGECSPENTNSEIGNCNPLYPNNEVKIPVECTVKVSCSVHQSVSRFDPNFSVFSNVCEEDRGWEFFMDIPNIESFVIYVGDGAYDRSLLEKHIKKKYIDSEFDGCSVNVGNGDDENHCVSTKMKYICSNENNDVSYSGKFDV